jgi:hypothetical protein
MARETVKLAPAPLAYQPIINIPSQQMAILLALEPVCQAAGLWVVCPVCARELGTVKHLITNNHPEDITWQVTCPCTKRLFQRASLRHSMTPSGDLLTAAATLFPIVRLAVRCPVKQTGCLTTDLQLTQRPDGVTARCQCWQMQLGTGTYTFRKKQTAPS